ncbi:hypothetical protein GGQ96_003039 [Sphingomonas abaci]|uniref:Uncharacterized protein n=1 Tax=Sphingomonas abaci TaxID=237611 RepID=A0A7W7AKT6_9SPHN|nr:hypothetical protein [Sphingomonas abaci]
MSLAMTAPPAGFRTGREKNPAPALRVERRGVVLSS